MVNQSEPGPSTVRMSGEAKMLVSEKKNLGATTIKTRVGATADTESNRD